MRNRLYHRESATLYHYPIAHPQSSTFIIFAQINRPDILDLTKTHSFIKALQQNQQEVFLVDWGWPTVSHTQIDIETLLLDLLPDMVLLAQKHSSNPLDLMGICQGGVYGLCYASLYPDHFRKLIFLVTPVDFHTPNNQLYLLTKYMNFDLLQTSMPLVSGQSIDWLLGQVKPFERHYKKLLTREKNSVHSALYQAVESWTKQCPDVPAKALCGFVKLFVQKNALMHADFALRNKTVVISAIKHPILNVYATRDHFWPIGCPQALRHITASTEYQELPFEGGHIGVLISKRAHNELVPKITQWQC